MLMTKKLRDDDTYEELLEVTVFELKWRVLRYSIQRVQGRFQ